MLASSGNQPLNKLCLHTEEHGGAGAEPAAGTADAGNLGVGNLAWAGFTAELTGCFDAVVLLTPHPQIEATVRAIVQDVTAQLRQEAELRRSELRFRRAFYGSPALMSITRLSDRTHVEVNDSWVRHVGVSRERAVGRTVDDFGFRFDPSKVREVFRQLEETKLVSELEFEATLPDFTPYYAQLAQQPTIAAGEVLDSDALFHRGTGEGWSAEGDV